MAQIEFLSPFPRMGLHFIICRTVLPLHRFTCLTPLGSIDPTKQRRDGQTRRCTGRGSAAPLPRRLLPRAARSPALASPCIFPDVLPRPRLPAASCPNSSPPARIHFFRHRRRCRCRARQRTHRCHPILKQQRTTRELASSSAEK